MEYDDEMRVCFVIALGIGCGSVSAKQDAGTSDTPVEIDAPPPPPCDLVKPFGTPIQVPGIHQSGKNNVHASLTADELTIVFGTNRDDPMNQIYHLYMATRLNRNDPFTGVTFVPGTYSTEGENGPSLSADGNTIFFDSYRVMNGLVHIFTSTRSSPAVQFPQATMLTGDYLIDPAITTDGKVLYAATLQTGGLVRMDKMGNGWSTPQPVALPAPSIVSPVTNDDMTMYVGIGDSTGHDIGVSKRASTTAAFPMVTTVPELDTAADVAEPSWLSPDGCRLYMNFAMGTGDQIIFVATKPL